VIDWVGQAAAGGGAEDDERYRHGADPEEHLGRHVHHHRKTPPAFLARPLAASASRVGFGVVTTVKASSDVLGAVAGLPG